MYLVKLLPADRPVDVENGEFETTLADGPVIVAHDFYGTAALLSLGIDGNRVASELLADYPEEWRTRGEVLHDIQDYPHQTAECKAMCDEIRAKFSELEG